MDDLWELVKTLNATVVGIAKSKLDDSINNCQICIKGYNMIRHDWNKKGRGVVCYVSNKICLNAKNCISNEIENIFIERLILKTKQISGLNKWLSNLHQRIQYD